MPPTRRSVNEIGNKIKKREVYNTLRKAKQRLKSDKRAKILKVEEENPELKEERLSANIPKTLENTRESDPSTLPTQIQDEELTHDLENDAFASAFSSAESTPKILITTSPQASKMTYEFTEELQFVMPGSEFIRRKKGKGFEVPKICAWAAKRGYSDVIVVNEDHKQPNAMTIVHLPYGPTAYFKLSSIVLMSRITGRAKATTHHPELVLNNFSTRLGHTVGRMFQALFPVMPEFEGRQVVTLHCQRDFLFFRRHRYAFRSTEKAALQEIGPRFTLKMKWLKKGTPQLKLDQEVSELVDVDSEAEDDVDSEADNNDQQLDTEMQEGSSKTDIKNKNKSKTLEQSIRNQDEVEWKWRPELETSKRKFFL